MEPRSNFSEACFLEITPSFLFQMSLRSDDIKFRGRLRHRGSHVGGGHNQVGFPFSLWGKKFELRRENLGLDFSLVADRIQGIKREIKLLSHLKTVPSTYNLQFIITKLNYKAFCTIFD